MASAATIPGVNMETEGDTAGAAAIVGLVALASAMGIGRFAFTPMLPLMQQGGNLTLVEGAQLASANYAGYLAGALLLTAWNPKPAASARGGLIAVAMLTLAMTATQGFASWFILRFLAGVASACVLVGISGWALPRLAQARRSRWSGIVFAGVGVGIALAGAIALVSGIVSAAPETAWLALGLAAALAAALVWSHLVPDEPTLHVAARDSNVNLRSGLRLVICYGAFGFGYIIPATFLPALAREVIPDPLVFGWAWPAFGIAAAASTLAAAQLIDRVPPAKVWSASQLAMAVGVIAPAVFDGLAPILVSAVLVGGSFMVVTMAGIQHARVVAGAAAPRLIAAMTAAFALGQLVGPMTIRQSGGSAIVGPSVIAAVALVASAFALLVTRPPAGSQSSASTERN